MRVTAERYYFLVILSIMGSYSYSNSRNSNCITKEKDKECTNGVRNEENQEALQENEDASQTLQLPFLRLERFADVSSFNFFYYNPYSTTYFYYLYSLTI